MREIKHFPIDHLLQQAIRKFGAGETTEPLRKKPFAKLEKESRGSNPYNSRFIQERGEEKNKYMYWFPRFISDANLGPALNLSMLRWTVYEFPVQ